MKKLLLVLLVLASGISYGQFYNAEEYRGVDNKTDSTLISGVGQIRFDALTGKWRFGNGSSWMSFKNAADPVVSTIGTINDGTESSNGASISGSTLYMQNADATYPGLVSTGAQTFAGAKTFSTPLSAASAPGTITSLGGLSTATQTFTAGSSGTDFNISSSGSTHTFNIPSASATARGLVTTGAQDFAGRKTFTASVGDAHVDINSADGGYSVLNFKDGLSSIAGEYWQLYKKPDHSFAFYNGAERFNITPSGNVGIGTTPTHKLDVLQSVTTNGHAAVNAINNGANVGTAYGTISQATGASVTNVGGYFSASGATNNYGLLVASGKVGIGVTTPTYDLDVVKATGSNTVIASRQTGTGEVGFLWDRTGGTTAGWYAYIPSSSTDLRFFNVSDKFTFATSGVGTGTDWVATSDRRLKTNIKPVGSYLRHVEDIADLVREYDRTDNKKHELGFIAQELEEVAPEYVNVPEDSVAMWSVNYSKMVVPLYKAVAELTVEVERLKKELNELKK